MQTPKLDRYLISKAIDAFRKQKSRDPNIGELVDQLIALKYFSAAEHALREQERHGGLK